jgi:multiple sugar transport system permease protein
MQQSTPSPISMEAQATTTGANSLAPAWQFSGARTVATVGMLILMPALLLSVVFEYWPAVRSMYLMFFNWNLVNADPKFVGLDNFRTVIADSRFHTALRNTVIYAGILAPVQILVPLAMALLLRALGKKGMGQVYRTLLFLPMVISLPVAAVVWLWMLNPVNGVANQLLDVVGLAPVNWLGEPRPAMASILLVAAWSSIGFNILLYLTALEGIAPDVREAARLDGANDVQLFFSIEWPLISPTFFFIVLTTILFVNNDIFSVINILTKGGPYSSTSNVLYYLYERGFKFFQAGEASALAMLLVAFFVLVTWIQFRVGERKVHYGS